MEDFTLKKLQNDIENTQFQNFYKSLVLNDTRSSNRESNIHLLKVAILLLNCKDSNLRKFGYRIVLRYSNLYNDYQPLFDVAVNNGYIPVSKFIEERYYEGFAGIKFINAIVSAFQDNFKQQNNVFLSFGQKELQVFSETEARNFVLVAPTSYGKSEIIINKIDRNRGKKICVLVPSKALLAQTKRRILSNESLATAIQRVITHPDMYREGDGNFVAVLTQERLLRLLQKNPSLSLDLVLVDEAHNLLKDDGRAILLSQVIMILLKRNSNLVLNFFTPFISDPENLKIRYTSYDIQSASTSEFIKIERYYLCDLSTDRKLYLYDQFLNDFFLYNDEVVTDDISFLLKHKASKNIAYVNRPRDIERLALSLSTNRVISISSELQEIHDSISDFVHPQYNLLTCIKSGVVYHHGGMPEIVRLYVENLFSTISELNFIVTSSTLLEGVNIPAEKIFLLTTKIGRKNFSKSEFKNLIGRVCRFSEVFNRVTGDLKLLEPQIYVLKGDYEASNANPRKFLRERAKVDIKITDEVNNLLLEEEDRLSREDKEKVRSSLEYLENIEPNTVEIEGVDYAESSIAKSCYRNNVYDFDILQNETVLIQNLENYERLHNESINDVGEIMEAIHGIFIANVDIVDEDFGRLANSAARKFYAMILDWRTTGSSYKQMIAYFIRYWSELQNPIVFVGSKWGEIPFDRDRFKELYIDLTTKSEIQRINLAIVRIKEEQDFVDNNIMKYIEILHDLDFLEDEFYDKLKYGTSDTKIICLLKNGFSMELAKTIINVSYSPFVIIDVVTDTVTILPGIVESMIENGENRILVFEIGYHI